MHVLACYTPLHLLAARLLVPTLMQPCIILAPRPESLGDYWPDELSVCRRITAPPARDLRGIWLHREQARRERDVVASLRAALGTKPYELHYSHLQEFAANALVFGRPRARHLHVLPDGILNYYDLRVDAARFTRILGKAAVAASVGLRFHPFVGSLTGADRPEVATEWSFDPGRSLHPSKARRLTMQTRQQAQAEHALLLLGQESYARRLNPSRFLALWQRVITRLRDVLGDIPVLYKPHHLGIVDGRAAIHEHFTTVTTIASRQPAEELVLDGRADTVASLTSSALFHVRLADSTIRAISVGGHLVSQLVGDLQAWETIGPMFTNVGVELLELTEG